MNAEQQTFLDAQIFSMSLMATVQRNRHVYREGASDESKQTFRTELRDQLSRLAERYVHSMSEAEHVQNIVGLADHISASSPNALEGGRFKIGAAQKALNLYLKYMWCLGRIPTPPHCPFDSIVLAAIGCADDKWTEVDGTDNYVRWASLAKAKAEIDGVSLAEWELREYNKLQPSTSGSPT